MFLNSQRTSLLLFVLAACSFLVGGTATVVDGDVGDQEGRKLSWTGPWTGQKQGSKWCKYTCPSNSNRVSDSCPQSFKDCECDKGYYKKNGKCVQWCDYTCPSGS